VTSLLDTNVLVRHFTGEPEDQARAATKFLATANPRTLLLVDLVAAELVFVLQKTYDETPTRVADLLRAVLALPAVHCDNAPVLYRTLEIYEGGQHFTDAYLVATAEAEAIPEIVSFDRGILAVRGVRRIDPAE
jgi:predicted nucleic acid-binding protein